MGHHLYCRKEGSHKGCKQRERRGRGGGRIGGREEGGRKGERRKEGEWKGGRKERGKERGRKGERRKEGEGREGGKEGKETEKQKEGEYKECELYLTLLMAVAMATGRTADGQYPPHSQDVSHHSNGPHVTGQVVVLWTKHLGSWGGGGEGGVCVRYCHHTNLQSQVPQS